MSLPLQHEGQLQVIFRDYYQHGNQYFKPDG